MGKTLERRAARYERLLAGEAQARRPSCVRVYNRDRSVMGLAWEFGPDYTGEAGRSSRLRVLWPDGRTTLCCLKGMRPTGDRDEGLPGGETEWTIQ